MTQTGDEFLRELLEESSSTTADEWEQFSEKHSQHLGAIVRVTYLLITAVADEEGIKQIPEMEEEIAEAFGSPAAPKMLHDFGTIMFAIASDLAEPGQDVADIFSQLMRAAERSVKNFVTHRSSQMAAVKEAVDALTEEAQKLGLYDDETKS